MRFSKVVRMFKNGSVCVTGMKGTGKDLLFGNVIARRYEDYVSNLNYGYFYYKLEFSRLNCLNTYHNLARDIYVPFKWSYPDGADVYISDAGIYFPSQYCNELNKQFGGLISYMALSRQVSLNRVHLNAQNLNRCWDKMREQSDTYIRCRFSVYFFGYVLQGITIYDKYQSCVDRVKPCRVTVPLFNAPARMQAKVYRDNFFNTHGTVRNRILFYKNKSKHNTLAFREMFGNAPYDNSFLARIKRGYLCLIRKYRYIYRHSIFYRLYAKLKGVFARWKIKLKKE